jgi:hypothetical protein
VESCQPEGKEKGVFTLHLHYPQTPVAKGDVVTVRSTYVPPIGMEIYSPHSAAYRVTNVLAGITDGVLDEDFNVLLEATD